MDEVFGEDNFLAQINVMKTATPSALLDDNFFYVLWYAKTASMQNADRSCWTSQWKNGFRKPVVVLGD